MAALYIIYKQSHDIGRNYFTIMKLVYHLAALGCWTKVLRFFSLSERPKINDSEQNFT